MAQISINVDTVNKTVEVSIDGEVLEDVKYLSVWPPSEYDSFMLNIEKSSKLENGLRERVSLTANEDGSILTNKKSVYSQEVFDVIAKKHKGTKGK